MPCLWAFSQRFLLLEASALSLIPSLPHSWQCYTFPYYKPIDTVHFQGAGNHTLTPVPVTDPDYERLPWGQTGLVAWGLFLSVGPMAACFVFGAIYSLVAVRFGSGKPPAQAPLSLETYEVKEGYRTSAAMSLQEG